MKTLECIDLAKSFDGIHAVDHVNLHFEAGRITALVGPNGAGKTTLFHLITGFLKPDRGSILLKGKNIIGLSPWRIAEMGIGRLFQDVRVFRRMTALDNVRGAFRAQTGENPFRAISWRPRIAKEEKAITEKALGLLDFVGLTGMENEFAENLSFGQQKLLSIARLLANGAEILLLDEPTSGVNPAMISKLLDLIRRLAYEEKKTVVVIEHNMSIILELADWLYFLDEGKLTAFGIPSEVLADQNIREAYIGLQ